MELEEIVCKAIPITPEMCRINRQMAEHRRTELRKRIEEYVNEKMLSLTSKIENESTGQAIIQDSNQTG